MRTRLDPADRRFLIGLGLLVVIMIAATILFAPAGQTDTGIVPSSYSASSSGAKAAFLLLQKMGYETERWTRPATELPKSGAGFVYILADPTQTPSAGDKTAMRLFVRTGGHVLTTGILGAYWLDGGLPDWSHSAEIRWRRIRPSAVSQISSGIPWIDMRPGIQWDDPASDAVVVFGDDDGAAVLVRNLNQGRIVWWSNASPLTNLGLSRYPSDLDLFLNSLGLEEGTRVLWDEYYHGEAASLTDYLARTPLIWGLAQAALMFVLVWVTFGRRHGPVVPLRRASRLSPLEFADAMGDLYHSARAAAGAVSAAYERFRLLAGRKLGLPSTSSPAQLARAAVRITGYQDAELYHTLSQCDRAATVPVSESDALGLIQKLQEYSGTLGLLPPLAREDKDV